ncbi:hypothetical protein FHX36_004367 [Modestobacter versicolor]|uniref:Uncharacterized protein n=1 Tax=Modestobacter versicolor TaxID=429133 RepID=A0A839Y5W8_9ACTN|nr:hypothetical protein [Modestobacter versicolor]MBB3678578.1 hypothetical protein [Modestobacter versicolor]
MAADGGSRFDPAAPRTPTAVAGKPPSRTSSRTPSAPPTSSAAAAGRGSGRRASAMPSCQGTHQPVSTAVDASAPLPSGAATASTAGTAAAQVPSRSSSRSRSGVAASRARCTPRNHSGLSDRTTTARTRLCAAPCSDSATATAATPPASAATGPASARTRRHHHRGAASRAVAWLRAAPNPATRKNRPSVWNSQLAGASAGMVRSGLSSRTTPSTAVGAVTSQWPSTTPAVATTRRASIPGSLLTGSPPAGRGRRRPAR